MGKKGKGKNELLDLPDPAEDIPKSSIQSDVCEQPKLRQVSKGKRSKTKPDPFNFAGPDEVPSALAPNEELANAKPVIPKQPGRKGRKGRRVESSDDDDDDEFDHPLTTIPSRGKGGGAGGLKTQKSRRGDGFSALGLLDTEEEQLDPEEEGEEENTSLKKEDGGDSRMFASGYEALEMEEEDSNEGEQYQASHHEPKRGTTAFQQQHFVELLDARLDEAKDKDCEAAEGVDRNAGQAADTVQVLPKPSKSGKKKKSKKDLDFLFSALDLPDPQGVVQEEGEMDETDDALPAGRDIKMGVEKDSLDAFPEGKEKCPGQLEVVDEVDAQHATLGGSTSSAPSKQDGKRKKKKKGTGGDRAGLEEDLDAILAELDGKGSTASAPVPTVTKGVQTTNVNVQDEEEVSVGNEESMAAEVEEEGEKELTAAQKKRLKKKQKEKEKKAAGKVVEVGESSHEPAAPAKKGKAVKESVAVRKMREALEAKRKAEEEARQLEEEAWRREEEERLRIEEEEKRKKELAEKRKEEKKARKAQLKAEGKLLTGKAKAEAERLARMRAQLEAQAAERGMKIGEGDPMKPKKVVYESKRQLQRKKSEVKSEGGATPESRLVTGSPMLETDFPSAESVSLSTSNDDVRVLQPQAQKSVVQQAAPATDVMDDWEAAVENWEDHAAERFDDDAEEEEEQEEVGSTVVGAKMGDTVIKSAFRGGVVGDVLADALSVEEESDDDEEEDDKEEEEEEEEEEDDNEEDEDTADESSDEDGSSDYDSEGSLDSEEEREARIHAAREKRLARAATARASADKESLRSPICCILGHVDVGKTKILDNIRRTNVQDGEAGGITQQIGATFIPGEAIQRRTEKLRAGSSWDMKLPGLLVIDTPGHESFTNLRQRGSGLCDLAVLIVDLMHGLEQQTIESINLLKMRKTPFVIALNKVDRLYGWKAVDDSPIRESFKRQKDHVTKEFEDRSSKVFLELNEQGLNVALYWKNTDPKRFVNVVPTSAISGEGIPDLLQLIVKLTQTRMSDRLMYVADTQCTVLEVKTMEGLGTTVDVVLVNGKLKEGDRIVVCGLQGPIVTRIKALKTPQVLRELRVKGALMDHKEIRAAMGVKIVAPGLEHAVAGTQLYVVGADDDEEELRDAVMADMKDIFSKVDKGGEGVCVQASTLGSLEALLAFLSSDEVNIPVSAINIGPVHKKDVLRANVMNEKGHKKYSCILAFDVSVAREAKDLADEFGVRIFTADIIYHLFDQFTAYMKQIKAQEQEAARLEAVFPCTLKIIPTCIFNKKDPIVVGVEVVEGVAKIGTPLCVPSKESIDLGRIASMELNHKPVDAARAGQSVAMKIEGMNATEQSRLFGRHFDENDQLVSRISRESINALKAHFADEMTREDWRLVVKLKKVFDIA